MFVDFILLVAAFIGFNHHRQTCVFGAALLIDETIPSFEWLFHTFVKCMNGKAPVTMYTDQDLGIIGGVKNALPNTFHAYCTWHLMENMHKYVPAGDKKRFEYI